MRLLLCKIYSKIQLTQKYGVVINNRKKSNIENIFS